MPRALKSRFLFVANHPGLDFLNTEVVEQGRVVDRLRSSSDLGAWLLVSGLITQKDLRYLQRSGAAKNTGLLRAARGLRRSMRQAVSRIANHKPVPVSAIREVNRILGRGRVVTRLELRGGKPTLTARRELRRPADLLVPLAAAASDLLSRTDFRLIRKCENPRCILYFYDVSKNHARRWCSMDTCGSQNKARAYYRRKRAQ